MIGAPSRLRLIRKAEALAKIKLTRDLSIESGRILHWFVAKAEEKMYMSVGVTKDYKLKLRKLRASHTLG